MDILERKSSTAATGTIKLDFIIVANNEMMVLIVIWTLQWRIVDGLFLAWIVIVNLDQGKAGYPGKQFEDPFLSTKRIACP